MPTFANGENLGSVRTKINDAIELVDISSFLNVAAVLADTSMTYSTVAAGDIVRTRSEGFSYQVAASGATDQHVTTAGGVKLYVLPSNGSWEFDAFAPAKNGATDDASKMQTAIDAISAAGGGRLLLGDGVYRTASVVYIKSNVHVVGTGYGSTEVFSDFALVSGTKGIIRSSAFAFDGSNPDDDYTTFSSSTGDYFTTGPRTFAAASTFIEGAQTFTAASSSGVADLAANDWVHLSEGIPSWHPAKSEFVQVESIVGTTVTVKTGLRNGYSNAATSLGAFIRSYDLTVNPGGGAGGYPNMSLWADAGFRKVIPVTNAGLEKITIRVARNVANSKIAWITHLAVGVRVDVEIINGTFWNIDSQDVAIRVRGGAQDVASSYLGNGCNGVVCDVDITNQVALEEGAQNVRGVVRSDGYNAIKDYVSQCDLVWSGSAGSGQPGLECSIFRDVTIRPSFRAGQAAVRVTTPSLATIATNLPQAFLTGEVARYFLNPLTLIGGECISTGSPSASIETTNAGQIRCIDTVVPVVPSGRYKGSVVVNGRRAQQTVSTFPLYNDLEVGGFFHSDTYGAVEILGVKETTISQQFNFGSGTLNCLIIDNFTTGGSPQVGDLIVFRLSDAAGSVTNWSWHVAAIIKVSPGSAAIEYSPANPAGRTAITATNEDRLLIFRTRSRMYTPVIKTNSESWEAEGGGFITGIGRLAGGPLQLGTYHLWVDSTGDLRIKNGVPTSDTDGTVVGTQT